MEPDTRTILYVYQPSSVTISATRSDDGGAVLYRYPGTGQAAIGTHKLDPGIYMVVSFGEVVVSGSNLEVVTGLHGKDIPPDPKLAAMALEPGASLDKIKEFFKINRDASPASNRPTAPHGPHKKHH